MKPEASQVEKVIHIDSIMFYSEQNGYSIVKFTTTESNGSKFVAKGLFPERPCPGTVFKTIGIIVEEYNAKLGRKNLVYKIKECFPSTERSSNGWIEYLIREAPFIGESRAEELVDLYGEEVISVMAEHPEKLISECKGVSESRAKQLSEWAKSEVRLGKVKQWLYRQGMTFALIARIIARHGLETPSVVKNDPYCLEEIHGIGFTTADKIAKKLGVSQTDKKRIRLGILHSMKACMENGHTCVYEHNLISKACELLEIHQDNVKQVLSSMIAKGEICNSDTNVRSISERYDSLCISSFE